MKTHRIWQVLTVVLLLAILGLGMLGEWTMWLLQGNLTEGIYTVENNSFIVCNKCADVIAAFLMLMGTLGLFIDHWWAHPITLIGGGMLICATIIGLEYTLHSNPKLSPMFIASLAIVLICFALLWSDQTSTQLRDRHEESHT